MTDDIYIGDEGVEIKYTIEGLSTAQLSGITLSQFHIVNPEGTHLTVTATRTGKVLKYSTLSTTMTAKGEYVVTPYIETSFGLKKHLDEARFTVKDPNDPD